MKLIKILLFLFSVTSLAQVNLLDQVRSKNDVGKYQEGKDILVKIDTVGFNRLNKAKYLYEFALCKINLEGEVVKSYQILLDAKRLLKNQSDDLLFKLNDELIYAQLSFDNSQNTASELMAENCAIAAKTQDPEHTIYCNGYLFYQIDQDDPLKFQKQLALLHKNRVIAERSNLKTIYGNEVINIATTHERAKQFDSAMIYYEKSRKYVENKEYIPTKIAFYNNIANTLNSLGRYDEAIDNLNRALQLSKDENVNNTKLNILFNLATNYDLNEEYEKSLESYKSYVSFKDSLNATERFNALQELETKYQVQERKLENAELSADNERQKLMIISIAGSALVLLLVAGFVYNNQRKKQRIAKQEMELEKQRADNLMKNQELATIDAMIQGQEKERKKLAEDLHDNLGSSLTTIRLYFDNLKNQLKPETSSEIYDRTDKLLEDTYATIRGMSHSRHNGVLASKGLIPTLKKLTTNISNSGKLQVDIFHHGMDRKIENSLELNIFRMLQELLSNIVKHAGASTASINIVGSDTSINLMVEDDGQGFILDRTKKTDGMGLTSIEARVEDMDGQFEIDSNPGHGTTITIEIPFI
ncbi:tetratricopeptide repeat-containing sensor histidine kinase [Nonlabens antarcticus]|uniref:tetratricopeptide repeat-containing sensor histidine kinase n=1 Tax=Nonlabens antarcticus TaxID=392714 RepID=UPI0018912160|nr:sensor histidine kinase [Nonlabens antarcticus]